MYNLCSKGKAVTRPAVLAEIRKTNMKATILGTPLRFAKNGNSRYAVFYLFHIVNGKYVPATTK